MNVQGLGRKYKNEVLLFFWEKDFTTEILNYETSYIVIFNDTNQLQVMKP